MMPQSSSEMMSFSLAFSLSLFLSLSEGCIPRPRKRLGGLVLVLHVFELVGSVLGSCPQGGGVEVEGQATGCLGLCWWRAVPLRCRDGSEGWSSAREGCSTWCWCVVHADVLDYGLHDRLVLLHGLLLVVHAVEDVGHEVGGE